MIHFARFGALMGALLASSVVLAQVQQTPAASSTAGWSSVLLQPVIQRISLPDVSGETFGARIELDGQERTLFLTPYSMRSDNFQVLVSTPTGFDAFEAPPPATYRGYVIGIGESRVAASLTENGLSALIDAQDGRSFWVIQPLRDFDPTADREDHVMYLSDEVVPHDGTCGVVDDMFVPHVEDGGVALGTGLRQVEIGVDADSQFVQDNGGSVTNTINDIENVLNATELVYERDVFVTFEITTIVVRTSGNDPYSGTGAGSLLNQFANQWQTSPIVNGITRDVAQYFTGRNLSGTTLGIANLSAVCSSSAGYSVVESRFTNIMSARVGLSAHELGHNFSAQHCDALGIQCKIMCSSLGGCGGLGLPNFGASEANQIMNFVNNISCDVPLADPQSLPFSDSFSGASISSSLWSFNDGGIASSAAVGEPSAPNSLQLNSVGADLYGDDDEIRSNFINLSGSANTKLTYWTQHRGVESGERLIVEYWAANLRWVVLNTITSNGVDQNTFTMHQHTLPTGTATAYHPEFRVRFRVDGNDTGDTWYIDDVSVTPGPPPPPNIVHQMVEVPISPAAIADNPALAGKKCFDLQVVMSNGDDWTASEVEATLDGTFYQDPDGADFALQPLWGSNPSMQFDSFWCGPNFSIPSFAVTPEIEPGFLAGTWFDTTTTGNGTFTLARFTCLSGTTLEIVGNSTTAEGSSTLFPFAFSVEVGLGTTQCAGDFDGDGDRDLADLGVILAAFGVDNDGDMDSDNDTDLGDLGAFLSLFQVPCP